MIITKYKEAEKLPNKFFINVCVLEDMEYPPYSSMIDVNIKMRDVLIESEKYGFRHFGFNNPDPQEGTPIYG